MNRGLFRLGCPDLPRPLRPGGLPTAVSGRAVAGALVWQAVSVSVSRVGGCEGCVVRSPAPRGWPFVTAAALGAVVLGAAIPDSGKAQPERQARALRGEPWDRAPRPRERRPVPVCALAFPGAARGGLSSSVLP